ncbi:MAG: hypothetical protein H3C34_13675 [Caldilineaceae bacterium]|nr:hypothetical protein [Caldilineaceae bacterium]
MGKGSYLLIGAVIGAAAAALLGYLFGPAEGTTYDENYRSRLDFALDEGRRAAAAREHELRHKIEEYRRLPSPSAGQTGGKSNGAGPA